MVASANKSEDVEKSMELSDRKLQILKAVIEEYTAAGAPVGSRVLAKRKDLAYSAATIRNEMADLEEMGYLEKPHTSAGRVPTQEAYRLYVDSLIDVGTLSEAQQAALRASFEGPLDEVGEIYVAAVDAISKLTGYIALVASPRFDEVILRRIQIVRVARGRAMAIIVTETGIVREERIPVEAHATDADLETISSRVSDVLAGRSLRDAPNAAAELVREASEKQKAVMRELFSAINKNKDAMEMFLGGRQNIWLHPEYRDWEKAQRFLAFLDTKERLERLLQRTPDPEFSISIGPEAAGADLPDLGVVTGIYRVGRASASFGVIGPARMNYPKVLPVLRSVGARMSSALGNLTESGGDCG